jgi:hypothetical protein
MESIRVASPPRGTEMTERDLEVRRRRGDEQGAAVVVREVVVLAACCPFGSPWCVRGDQKRDGP